MTPKNLLKKLKEFTSEDIVHMYIIERKIRPGIRVNDKPSLKFDYIPLQVNLSEELAPIVIAMLSRAIDKKVKEDTIIAEYEVIDDTIDKLYTYKDLGKIKGFQYFLTTQLGKEIKPLKSFEELEQLEKAWAVCYGLYNSENSDWLYCIKKLSPRKIAVETETSTSIGEAVKHGITSLFDTKTKTLKPFNGFSINIEPSIDMIYLDKLIYVFQKKAFEDITSLTEEFEHVAQEVVDELSELKVVGGIEHLSHIITQKPAYRDKLIKAKTIGNIDFLKTCKDIKKEFKRTGKKLEITFNFDSKGNIIASSEEDAENIIKVLCEFYKEGIFGGKIFESPAGRLKI